jgi:hypothetical protein
MFAEGPLEYLANEEGPRPFLVYLDLNRPGLVDGEPLDKITYDRQARARE